MKTKGRNTESVGGAGAPYLGRERELDEAERVVAAVASSERRLLLVSGDAGIGKSHFIREVTARAQESGFLTAIGRCWEATDAPAYWVWTQVLESLGIESPFKMDVSLDRFAQFQAVDALLRDLADAQPIMTVLEDLHAADESSLLLMRFLIGQSASTPILIVGSYDPRTIKYRPDLVRAMSSLVPEATRIELEGLDVEHVTSMYERIAGSLPSEPIAHAIQEASQGNPFFIQETVRLLISKGDLHRPDHSVGFRVPEGARDIIRARLAMLPEASHETLGIASVLGRQFELSLLESVAELDLDTLLGLLEEPMQKEILEEAGALGNYRFTHVLLREVLYEDLTAARRMRLHLRVGQVLEELRTQEQRSDLSELAHHWFKAAQAGDFAKTVGYSLEAARQARDAHAFEESARLFRRALKAVRPAKLDDRLEEEIKKELVDVKRRVGISAPSTGADEMVFRKEGDVWLLVFGGTSSRIRDSKGVRYIAQLLANPSHEIHSIELAQLVEGIASGSNGPLGDVDAGSDPFRDTGDILDPSAKAAYKRRIRELQTDIEEADAYNDTAAATRAQLEMDALEHHLAGALGLGGKVRASSSPSERARVNTTRTIKDALRRISQSHPSLGEHLQATIRTGTYSSYTPDPRLKVSWTL